MYDMLICIMLSIFLIVFLIYVMLKYLFEKFGREIGKLVSLLERPVSPLNSLVLRELPDYILKEFEYYLKQGYSYGITDPIEEMGGWEDVPFSNAFKLDKGKGCCKIALIKTDGIGDFLAQRIGLIAKTKKGGKWVSTIDFKVRFRALWSGLCWSDYLVHAGMLCEEIEPPILMFRFSTLQIEFENLTDGDIYIDFRFFGVRFIKLASEETKVKTETKT